MVVARTHYLVCNLFNTLDHFHVTRLVCIVGINKQNRFVVKIILMLMFIQK